MFKLRYLFPALILCAAAPAVSEAQSSVPLYTTTYSVQVQKEHWRSGGSYWQTVFETEDAEDAELMLDLLQAALEADTICEIVGCGFDYIITDVRLVSKRNWNIYPADEYEPLEYERNYYYLK